MGVIRQTWIGLVSEVSWRLPGWPVRLLTGFSQAERGSCYDMLAAVEATERRDMRLKYFRHAMDESRHAGLFLSRARAQGGMDRTQAVVSDAGYLTSHGIVGGKTLIERMGDLEFLAFVYVAEDDAVEQFNVYLDRELPDEETSATLRRILKDERFHVSYSRAALDFYRKQGREKEVARALRKVRWDRWKEAWLRFSVVTGHVVGSVWLTLMYALLVAPFRLLARLDDGGWHAPRARLGDPLRSARAQG
jgi:hypothetical protein